jgi:hypothetical protein
MKLSVTQKLALIAPTVMVLVLCAGCSGINTTQSVSPATILTHGLLQADPPQPMPDPTLPLPEESPEIALAR